MPHRSPTQPDPGSSLRPDPSPAGPGRPGQRATRDPVAVGDSGGVTSDPGRVGDHEASVARTAEADRIEVDNVEHIDNVVVVDEPPGPAAVVPRFLQVGAAWGWRFLVLAGVLFVLVQVMARLLVVVVPVLVALLVAAALSPLVGVLERRRVPRLAATWVVLLGALAALGALVWFTAPPLGREFSHLGEDLDAAVIDLKDWARTGPLGLSETQVDDAEAAVHDAIDNAVSGVRDHPGDSIRLAVEVVTGVLLTLVLSFFFLHDGPRMWGWYTGRVRPERRDGLHRAGTAAFASLQGWLRGVAVTGIVEAVLIGTALALLGVPAVIPLALLTFAAAFFPIVGATAAGVLATAVALASEGPRDAIVIGVVTLAVQQIEGDLLMPLVMRRHIALHPAVILVALAAGAALAGVVGALLAVPLTAAVTAATAELRPSGTESPTGEGAPRDDAEEEEKAAAAARGAATA